MKKLSPKAFIILIIGLIASIVNNIISYFLQKEIDFSEYDTTGVLTSDMLELMQKMVNFALIISLIISIFIALTFIFFVIKNKNAPKKQIYIVILLVLNIIPVPLNAFSIISGDIFSIIAILINLTIVAGCVIQRKYIEPVIEDSEVTDTNNI